MEQARRAKASLSLTPTERNRRYMREYKKAARRRINEELWRIRILRELVV